VAETNDQSQFLYCLLKNCEPTTVNRYRDSHVAFSSPYVILQTFCTEKQQF